MRNRIKHSPALIFFALIVALGLAHLLVSHSAEPFFYNDETRHVMTGVYFRDLMHDLPLTNLREYTINYYLQYPALGLLVWPPFFYFIEGLFMSLFGTSLIVSKILIGCFAAMACAYLFQLVRHTHDTTRAAIAVLVFGLAPLVFQFSSYVMLEIPTVALALAAIYHFVRYLDTARRLDLLLASVASALAALTRFDAVFLLPTFIILLIVRKRWNLLRRKEVIVAGMLAVVLVLPVYAITAKVIGWFHMRQATETLSPSFPGFLTMKRFLFYPSNLSEQLSLFALIPALAGIIFCLASKRREAYWPYLAMIVATYLTFTPIGEMDSRHSIYWIPAFALFAAVGLAILAEWLRTSKLYLPLAGVVIAGMGWNVLARPQYFVRGFEDAAQFVVANSATSRFCLFLGRLNGNFVYQIRRYDPNRRLWVLRADKLLFSSVSSSEFGYTPFTASDEEVMTAIFKYDPELIVIEDPKTVNLGYMTTKTRADFEARVRAILKSHPERFRLEKEIAVDSNDPDLSGMRIQVFRNLLRNDQPERRLEIDLQMIRRSLQTDVP